MSDDAEARLRRAARLRERITELTGRTADSTPAAPGAAASVARRNAPRVHPPSPRAFVEERMRELDYSEGQTKH